MYPYIVSDICHYRNVTVAKCTRIPPHLTRYYDLTFVVRGEMTYYADGKRFDMHENDAILLPPGTLRERDEGKARVEYVSFNFYISPEEELNVPPFLRNVITADIKKLTAVFPHKRLTLRDYSKEKLINLLNYILFEILESISLESNNPDIIKIKKLIDERIYSKITLEMLGEHVHLTKEYVSYIFKKHTGKTVIEYVNERKMNLAKQMIDDGEMSLKDIAENLGFENYGYFSRVFKNHFGTPPVRTKIKK